MYDCSLLQSPSSYYNCKPLLIYTLFEVLHKITAVFSTIFAVLLIFNNIITYNPIS